MKSQRKQKRITNCSTILMQTSKLKYELNVLKQSSPVLRKKNKSSLTLYGISYYMYLCSWEALCRIQTFWWWILHTLPGHRCRRPWMSETGLGTVPAWPWQSWGGCDPGSPHCRHSGSPGTASLQRPTHWHLYKKKNQSFVSDISSFYIVKTF